MKTFNAYICAGNLGSNMKYIGTYNTVREARAAAKAAYHNGETAANNLPAGAYAWQNSKKEFCFSWK